MYTRYCVSYCFLFSLALVAGAGEGKLRSPHEACDFYYSCLPKEIQTFVDGFKKWSPEEQATVELYEYGFWIRDKDTLNEKGYANLQEYLNARLNSGTRGAFVRVIRYLQEQKKNKLHESKTN